MTGWWPFVSLALASVLALGVRPMVTPVDAVKPGVKALAAPAGLTVVRFRPDVVLEWSHPSAGVTGYEIERNAGGGPFARIGVAAPGARTFRDRTARVGLTYAYRVRAVAGETASPYSSEVVVSVNASAGRSSPGTRGTR